MVHKPPGFDLGFKITDGRRRFGGDPQACAIGRGARLGNRGHKILDRGVEVRLNRGEGFEKPIPTGSKLFDLGAPGLSLPRKVTQYPLTHRLSLMDHLPTMIAALLDDLVSFETRGLDQF